jgi:hypothetical protein
MANKVQNIIEAALTEQVQDCYTSLNQVLAQKLAAPINEITKNVGRGIMEELETEDYWDRRQGEAGGKPPVKKPKKVVKESYEAQTPEVQRGIDFVVEHVAKFGTKAFGPSVERAEEQFGIYNESLKNYFANAIAEDFSLKPKSAGDLAKRKVNAPMFGAGVRGKEINPENDKKWEMGTSKANKPRKMPAGFVSKVKVEKQSKKRGA